MDLFGRILFYIYGLALLAAAPILLPLMALKLRLKGRSRAGIRQRLGIFEKGLFSARGDRTVWIHAVSVGETLAAIPMVRELKRRRRGVMVYFSTVTETGNAVARKELDFDDVVFYFPLDLPMVSDRVVRAVNPDAFVVVETEIWPGVLAAMQSRGVPSVMVNGRISPRSYRGYLRFRFFISRILGLITRFNMQTAMDADRIKTLGAPSERVAVTGNVKFDQAFKTSTAGTGTLTRASLGISDETTVFVAGSTHPGEETEAIKAYRRMLEERPDTVMVLAPRHPERVGEVGELLNREGLKFKLKSKHKGGQLTAPSVLLVDTMGELSGLYKVGDVNFVGGSWVNIGGHNVLEPVAHGKPVFFGPVMHNFAEIAAILKDNGVGIEVKDGTALAREAGRLLGEPERLEKLGVTAKETLHANRGAVTRNVDLIEDCLYG